MVADELVLQPVSPATMANPVTITVRTSKRCNGLRLRSPRSARSVPGMPMAINGRMGEEGPLPGNRGACSKAVVVPIVDIVSVLVADVVVEVKVDDAGEKLQVIFAGRRAQL